MLSAFHYLFSCCCLRPKEHSEPDENPHHIPVSDDPTTPVLPHAAASVDYGSITRRLDTIVRSTEGRMVNVTARLPFNLYNQPPSPHANPSPSRHSSNRRPYSPYRENSSQPPHRFASSRQSIESNSSYRPSEQVNLDDDVVERQPILNVRLVKPGDGTSSGKGGRGRRLGRKGLEQEGPATHEGDDVGTTPHQGALPEGQNHPPPSAPKPVSPQPPPFQIHDAGDLSISWGD